MNAITSKSLLSLLFAVCLLSPAHLSADQTIIKDFKKQWRAAVGDTEKQVEAIELLAAVDSEDGVKTLLKYGFHDSLEYLVHDAAFKVLEGSNGPGARAFILKKGLKEKDYRHRIILVQAVGGFAESDAIPFLTKASADKIAAVKVAAIEELENFRVAESVDAVIETLRRASGTLKDVCKKALQFLTGKKGVGEYDQWTDWWTNNRDKFDFSQVDKKLARDGRMTTVTREKLVSTVDGSGIYETIVSERLVFVLDTSGSMQIAVKNREGKTMSRLDYVKRELIAAIESQLTKDHKFSVLHFGDKVSLWKAKLVAGTKANKKKAVKFIKGLKPFGLTNTYGAFETAFKLLGADTIYFLTDGTPTAGTYTVRHDIRGRIRKWNRGRKIKIHTIAFLTGNGDSFGVIEDKPGSKEFMKAIASENNGDFRIFQ